MSDNDSVTKTSAVHDLSAQKTSCNDESVMFETDSMTETSAVYY